MTDDEVQARVKARQFTMCDDCGKLDLYHDEAVWMTDGSSYCPTCRPPTPAALAERHWEGEPEDTLARGDEIRALADTDGLAMVEELRKERDAVATARDMMGNLWAEAKADLAAVDGLAMVETMQEFVKWCSTANSLHQVQMRAHQLLEDKSD